MPEHVYRKPSVAEDKAHYSQADDKWLQEKIRHEQESVVENTRHIEDSKRDISICMDILIERGVGLN